MRGLVLLCLGLAWALLGCRAAEPLSELPLPTLTPPAAVGVVSSPTAGPTSLALPSPTAVVITVIVTATPPAGGATSDPSGSSATTTGAPTSTPPAQEQSPPPVLQSPPPPPPPPAGTPPPEVCGRPLDWVDQLVGPSDTLAGLAACVGLSPGDLMLANCLAGPDLLPGQPLVVPQLCLPSPSPTSEVIVQGSPAVTQSPVAPTETPTLGNVVTPPTAPQPGPIVITFSDGMGPRGMPLTLTLKTVPPLIDRQVRIEFTDSTGQANLCYQRFERTDDTGVATHEMNVPGFFPSGALNVSAVVVEPLDLRWLGKAFFLVTSTGGPVSCAGLWSEATATPLPSTTPTVAPSDTPPATPTIEATAGPSATPEATIAPAVESTPTATAEPTATPEPAQAP